MALETATHTTVSAPGGTALGPLIDGLGPGDRWTPILDWTSLGMAELLPERTLFRPVRPAARVLPYLDHTIEVVLVDDAARMDEAARVAADSAVLVTIDDSGEAIAAQTRRVRSTHRPEPTPVLIVVATDADDEWLDQLAQAVAGRPGVEVIAALERTAAAALETDTPTVVLAERGVVPLPQCVEAAERILAAKEEVGGVAVKLLSREGSLEAAGAAAFADGSVEGIARDAPPSAPWHDYVRPVAAAVGLVVLRPAVALEFARADYVGAFDLTAVSARLWSSGWELHYQPDAAAVRVLAPDAAARNVWPQPPDVLPARPDELDDATWRRLLARDEVGAVR